MNKDFAEGIEFCAIISGVFWMFVLAAMLMVFSKTRSDYYAMAVLGVGGLGSLCMSWIAKKMYLEQ